MDSVVNWLVTPFQSALMQNALKEMTLISLLAGVVGSFVVLRGIVFIVDGLSHAILPGIAAAFLLGGSIFWGALVAALVVSLIINLASRTAQVSEDSAIGIFFSGAFAVGVIVITKNLTRGRNLSDILFGQLFAVKDEDLAQTLVVAMVMVVFLAAVGKELLFSSFDPAMARAAGYHQLWLDLALYLAVALTVVVSLPAVGNILVLAFLITPAATARLLTDRFMMMVVLSVWIALLTSLLGLYISYYLGIPGGGATIVVSGSGLFLLVLLLSPRHGGLAWLMSRQARRRLQTHPTL